MGKVGHNPLKQFLLAFTLLLLFLLVACNGESEPPAEAPPTSVSLFAEQETAAGTDEAVETAPDAAADPAATPVTDSDDFVVRVDATLSLGEISPLVYGLSGAPPEVLAALRPALNSWGGNPSTRYNWRLGNAWNAGSDWFYQNTDYGYDLEEIGLPAHENFVINTRQVGAVARMAVPTLGWVARNSDESTCSFPLPDGSCGDASGATCLDPGEEADPTLTSVPSTPEDIAAWMESMAEEELVPRFIAMDNEPELWGFTHYDVHPTCTTYQEILDHYLAYAAVVREAVPEAELTGPVTCCWEFYWHSAAGSRDEARHDDQQFLPWFLDQVRAYDEAIGVRTLDVVDIHYYPEGIYNDEADPETAARRLRSTRSLWDRSYRDESWINDRIRLIPRMKQLIDERYPGTRLGISEWNWGADETMNGALAIADVLGILGREGVYFAAYWRYPPLESPGARAFSLYTNYDGQGSRFEGTALPVRLTTPEAIGAYAALDEVTGTMRLMLVNRQPDVAEPLRILFEGFEPAGAVTQYRYDESNPAIMQADVESEAGEIGVTLPPYSVTLLVIGSR